MPRPSQHPWFYGLTTYFMSAMSTHSCQWDPFLETLLILALDNGSFIHIIIIMCYSLGELSGPGAELLVRFHTSKMDRARYTIQTMGDTDMIVALLGPDDYTNVIMYVYCSIHLIYNDIG